MHRFALASLLIENLYCKLFFKYFFCFYRDIQGQVTEMDAELGAVREALADAQRSIAQARAEVDEAKQVQPTLFYSCSKG